jgi:2-polyprenyl-3-methyl-5-hydroxy-6-metoxy-1,4-benzoquinol methylase
MDEPGIDPSLHRGALAGLERINVVSRTVSSIWHPVLAAFRRHATRPFTILDVACGAGDIVVGLARRARRRAMPWSIQGCDISPTAVAHARLRAAEYGVDASFFRHDVLADPLLQQYDVVVCSLFLHHLDEARAIRLLSVLKGAARSSVIVVDLNRSALGLALAWVGTRLLTRSPVVRVDGLRSVRAAFTPEEARALCMRAGFAPSAVAPIWPCRWRMIAEYSR